MGKWQQAQWRNVSNNRIRKEQNDLKQFAAILSRSYLFCFPSNVSMQNVRKTNFTMNSPEGTCAHKWHNNNNNHNNCEEHILWTIHGRAVNNQYRCCLQDDFIPLLAIKKTRNRNEKQRETRCKLYSRIRKIECVVPKVVAVMVNEHLWTIIEET